MNLIDAVKSGRPFRRKHHLVWYAKFDGCLSERFRMGPNEDIHCELVMGDVIADDYEIQEPEVRITRAQFWGAAEAAFGFTLKKYSPFSAVEYKGPAAPPVNQVAMLAKRLGLET